MSQYTKEEILQHRAEWVAALRSGKYKQTIGNLRDTRGFCCLGVACDIAGLEAVPSADGSWFSYEDEGSILPDSAKEWLGVLEGDPRSANDDVYSVLNDEEELAFEQIADHFERYGFHPSIDVLAQEEDR